MVPREKPDCSGGFVLIGWFSLSLLSCLKLCGDDVHHNTVALRRTFRVIRSIVSFVGKIAVTSERLQPGQSSDFRKRLSCYYKKGEIR